MLKRKIIRELEIWKENHSHEALLVKGVRQVDDILYLPLYMSMWL